MSARKKPKPRPLRGPKIDPEKRNRVRWYFELREASK